MVTLISQRKLPKLLANAKLQLMKIGLAPSKPFKNLTFLSWSSLFFLWNRDIFLSIPSFLHFRFQNCWNYNLLLSRHFYYLHLFLLLLLLTRNKVFANDSKDWYLISSPYNKVGSKLCNLCIAIPFCFVLPK